MNSHERYMEHPPAFIKDPEIERFLAQTLDLCARRYREVRCHGNFLKMRYIVNPMQVVQWFALKAIFMDNGIQIIPGFNSLM
jgi:hypothetical protein